METNRGWFLSRIFTLFYYLMVLSKAAKYPPEPNLLQCRSKHLRKMLPKSNKNGSKTSTYKIYEENYH